MCSVHYRNQEYNIGVSNRVAALPDTPTANDVNSHKTLLICERVYNSASSNEFGKIIVNGPNSIPKIIYAN